MNTRGEYADLQAGNNNAIMPITLRINDIINPTSVKTSYSKTIKLPFTDTNDRIFSQYFKLDKLVSTDSFNALEKTPFTIFINGTEKLFEGWVMLNKITKEGYEITLFSNENKLFNELAEKKLNELDIDFDHKINRNYVWNSWNSDDGLYGYLKYSPAYQGLYNNFSNNKVSNANNTGFIELENDIDEYEKFELRSYYQHPSVKVSKLIEQICNENNITMATEPFFSENNPYWSKLFMVNPKYYNKDSTTSIFKPTYRSELGGLGKIEYNSEGNLVTSITPSCNVTTIYDDFNMESNYKLDLTKYPSGMVVVDWEFDIEVEVALSEEMIVLPVGYGVNVNRFYGITYRTNLPYNTNQGNGFCRIVSLIDGQNNVMSYNELRYSPVSSSLASQNIPYATQDSFSIILKPETYIPNNYQKIHFANINSVEYDNFVSIQSIENYENLPTKFRVKGSSTINNDGSDKYIKFMINGYNKETNTSTTPAFRLSSSAFYIEPQEYMEKSFYKDIKFRFKVVDNNNLRITVKSYTNQIRSEYKLTKENLLDPSITQSTFLINYMKMFGLMVYFDKVTNKYILSTRNKFYENAEHIDWTDKVNPNEIELEPNDIKARKYIFKYTDINTTHYNRYKDIFNQEYGSVYIDTNNQHFDNTEEFYTSIFSCPLIEQSYNLDNYNVQYRLPWQALGWCSYDGFTRSASIPEKPTLVFWNGLKNQQFTLPDMDTYIVISDDTSFMINNNEYHWGNYPQKGNGANSIIKCLKNGLNVFPQFTTLLPFTASLDFAVPKLTFFETETNALTDDICIYNRFYEGYVNDKLSVHNRILDIPVNLNNNDILNFKFNNFYFIKNTPYVVIEIVDYNPATLSATKVKLQRVIDLNNYTEGQTILINDIRTIGSFTIPSQSGELPSESYLYTIYRVPNNNLVTDEGYYYDDVYHSEVSIGDEEIDMTIPRGYQEDFKIVRPYIVYDGLTYLGDPFKLSFIPYTATFSGFEKTIIGETISFALDYVTNGVVINQGMYINGVEYIDSNGIIDDNETPINITGLPFGNYNITGWIRLEDNRVLTSNSYYVQS